MRPFFSEMLSDLFPNSRKSITFAHMAKKKKNKGQNGQQNISPERFIRERMRSVKIGKCYMTSDFDSEQGLGYVVITREHTGGRLSFAAYLVDKWCIGVKKTFFNLRVDEDVVDTLLERLGTTTDLMEVGYNEAHNMVWGAVAFAEEAGIKPCKDFALTQYFLEDDTDDIPLIEYDYGHDGKYFLMANNNRELEGYLSQMRKVLKPEQYLFAVTSGDDVFSDEENEEEARFSKHDKWDSNNYNRKDYPNYYRYDSMPYTYKATYPTKPAKLAFPEVAEIFSSDDHYLTLGDNDIDHILSLPHDALRQQLEQTILFGLGRINDGKGGLSKKAGAFDQIIMHALIILGNLEGGEQSLKVVLETLRQPEDVYTFLYGDSAMLVAQPAIVKLGHDHLPLLQSFLIEEGIMHYGKCCVIESLAEIADRYPDKRCEVLDLFSSVIDCIIAQGPSATFTDYALNGILVWKLLDLQAEELLPKIKQMYDLNLVNRQCCGYWKDVEHKMKRNTHSVPRRPADIKEIYRTLKSQFG